jgi:hypothetical protein
VRELVVFAAATHRAWVNIPYGHWLRTNLVAIVCCVATDNNQAPLVLAVIYTWR